METVDRMRQEKQTILNEMNRKLELKRKMLEEYRSDTDSGHSSVPGDIYDNRHEHQGGTKLKVTKCSQNELKKLVSHEPNRAKMVGVIAQNTANTKLEAKESDAKSNKGLQVVKRRDAILKRKHMARRNTIDINHLDIHKANQCIGSDKFMLSASKSTNCIDKVDAVHDLNGNLNNISMPDLDKEPTKFATLPNLRVRRPSRIVLNENNSSDDEDQSIASNKSKIPEFIANSSLPYQEMDISDAKVIFCYIFCFSAYF